MFVYYRFHVIHTTIAYFNGVPIKDFTELMMGWNFFAIQLHKLFADIGIDILAEGRVKPYI